MKNYINAPFFLEYMGSEARIIADAKRRIDTNMRANIADAIRMLSTCKTSRNAFEMLLPFVVDERFGQSAIASMAEIGDSRAIFPLLNVYQFTQSPDTEKAILQFIKHTRDPRAVGFLETYVKTQTDDAFLKIAHEALEVCRDNHDFKYRFSGDERTLELAKPENRHGLERILVTAKNLDQIQAIITEDEGTSQHRPQTFIVDLKGDMYVGGYLLEHVQVAYGKEVLAAGEIYFSKENGRWRVDEVNNRSTGYFPAVTSKHWVKGYLSCVKDIEFDESAFNGCFPREGFDDIDFLSIFAFGEHYKE